MTEHVEPRSPEPRGGASAGVPYPSSTDPLMDGAAAIQTLATYLAAHGYGESIESSPATGFYPGGTDANTITKTGTYGVLNMVNNYPGGPVWTVVNVLAWNPLYVRQTAWPADNQTPREQWVRWSSNGVWTAWSRVPTGHTVRGLIDGNGGASAPPVGDRLWVPYRLSTGVYKVVFTPAFQTPPCVIVQPVGNQIAHSVDLPIITEVVIRFPADTVFMFTASDMR